MTFGEKARTARKAKDISQRELAKRSGLSFRTIQNYETGQRMPKSRSSYTHLAEALGINENALLDPDAVFVLRAAERYGNKAADQAQELVTDLGALWAGGTMDEEDMDAIMEALQQAFWEAKRLNRKYVNKRYRKDGQLPAAAG